MQPYRHLQNSLELPTFVSSYDTEINKLEKEIVTIRQTLYELKSKESEEEDRHKKINEWRHAVNCQEMMKAHFDNKPYNIVVHESQIDKICEQLKDFRVVIDTPTRSHINGMNIFHPLSSYLRRLDLTNQETRLRFEKNYKTIIVKPLL
jgi:hypothetical protein